MPDCARRRAVVVAVFGYQQFVGGVSAIAWDWVKIGRISHRLIGYIFIVLGKRGNDCTARLGKLTV